jgi:hypothetical protein
MKIKCIACDALTRPVYFSAAVSPNIIDIELVKRGLHLRPDELRMQLQTIIDQTEAEYEAITLVYGLCGQSIAGLEARSIPLIIPRAHDCITLFLGSRKRYKEQFENYPGTYWYAHDYIERDDGSGGSLSLGPGAATSNLDEEYQRFVDKYGQENADYLMSVMGAWQKHYQRAVFIDMGIGDSNPVKDIAKKQATERGWAFEELSGDLIVLRKLFDGSWLDNSDEDFLVVKPGFTVTMVYDDAIISCKLSSKS